ncbi:MAG TPA: HEPN domain-containing protein [Thermoplasmata archaeon]|nr:HEPN domain-containing protein [Thermoplasmata archaeon]
MNLRRLALDQLARGQNRARDARRAFDEGRWADTFRYSQEAVELALKALLRWLAIEVPKRHDVGPILERVPDQLPRAVRARLPAIVQLSASLADRRAWAMYGDEATGRAASEVFNDQGEAGRFLKEVEEVVALVARAMPVHKGT